MSYAFLWLAHLLLNLFKERIKQKRFCDQVAVVFKMMVTIERKLVDFKTKAQNRGTKQLYLYLLYYQPT